MTNYATKTHVDDKIAALVGTAPLILNTLQEIASSINNDNTFSTTMVNALATEAPLADPALTGIATAANLTVNAGGNLKVGTTNIITELGLKAPINNPTFTGTVNGISKSMIQLTNVDDTSDANKPISSLTQNALDLKQSTIVTTETGNICTTMGNKKIVATSDNKLKFQTFDDDGLVATDSWIDMASIEWNTNTNKITFRITDSLVVNGTDIIT